MRIQHSQAVQLERIIRTVFNCDRAGMGGYIDADHFESKPFDAALIAIAPLWNDDNAKEVGEFLFKWDEILRCNQENDIDIVLYINDLKRIISEIK